MLWRRVVALACVVALAASCADEADPPPIAALARPVHKRNDIALAPAPRSDFVLPLARALAAPKSVSPWRVEGASAVVEGASLRLSPSGAQRVSVTIPGPHDLRRCASVVLRVDAPASRALELTVKFDDGEVHSAQAVGAEEFANPAWRVLRARLPRELRESENVASIELEFTGDLAGELTLDAIGFEWAAATGWLPFFSHDGPAPFPLAIAGDCRPSSVLRAGRLLRGRTRCKAPGSKLVFSYAALDPLRGKPSAVELRGRVRTQTGAQREFALEIPTTARWREYECEIELAAGDEVELELELVVSGNGTACAAITGARLRAPQAAAPTVILITSDTHRGDHLGAAQSGVELQTPALDALAARGVLFEDCFSTTNITIPSHVAILTGEHPLASGVIGNNMTLGTEPATLAERFHAAGYTTFAVTSINLLSSQSAGVERGFDRIASPQAARSAQRSVDIALEWLAGARDEPVFLWLHVFDAHAPYATVKVDDEASQQAPEEQEPAHLDDDGSARIPPWAGPDCDVACIRGLYGREISFVDGQLARLLAHERSREAVIAFTGDHGEVLGNHGIFWAHKALYPDTLHVPLILAWPGVAASERTPAPVSNADLGRTLLDLAGLADSTFPGRNLLSAAHRVRASAHPRFGLEGRARSASITLEGWHLMLQLEAQPEHERHETHVLHEVRLYHLPDDAACERDLLEQQFDKARELRRYLARWLGEWQGERHVGAVRQDAETLRELARLGYADSGAALGAEPLLDPECACAWCARFR